LERIGKARRSEHGSDGRQGNLGEIFNPGSSLGTDERFAPCPQAALSESGPKTARVAQGPEWHLLCPANGLPVEGGPTRIRLRKQFASLLPAACETGVFEQLWKLALEEYDEWKGIQWKWQSIDGATSKAPLGGEKNRAQSHGSRQVGDQAVAADGRRRGSPGGGCGRGQHARQAVG